MKPLNAQGRRVALMKFFFIGLVTLIFIPLMMLLYQSVPEASFNRVTAPDTVDENLLANIRQKLATAPEHQSKVNIMMVVDATPGMESFLPAVADAADQIAAAYPCTITAASAKRKSLRNYFLCKWGYQLPTFRVS